MTFGWMPKANGNDRVSLIYHEQYSYKGQLMTPLTVCLKVEVSCVVEASFSQSISCTAHIIAIELCFPLSHMPCLIVWRILQLSGQFTL